MRRYSHPTQIPRSKTIRSIDWQSDLIRIKDPHVLGDTHPMTWAADGDIYIGTGDPQWCVREGKAVTSEEGCFFHSDPYEAEERYRRMSGTAVERISGDPENMRLERINDMPRLTGMGASGSKPTGMISVDGVLYMAIQNLLGWKPPHFGSHCQHGSDASITCSRDLGKTWNPDFETLLDGFMDKQYTRRHRSLLHYANRSSEWSTDCYERASYGGWKPMFPGDWFGTPSFVQFGKDNAEAVDDYIYAVSSDQFDNGTNLRVGRVAKNRILEAGAWEFATYDCDGNVGWTSDIFSSDPMLEVYRHIGAAEMVYLPALKKYLTATYAFHTDFEPRDGSELTILESDHPWGPFSLVFYEWMWYKREAGGYCPRIPLKWFNHSTLSGYLEWAGNYMDIWSKPYYAPSVRKFKLILA